MTYSSPLPVPWNSPSSWAQVVCLGKGATEYNMWTGRTLFLSRREVFLLSTERVENAVAPVLWDDDDSLCSWPTGLSDKFPEGDLDHTQGEKSLLHDLTKGVPD